MDQLLIRGWLFVIVGALAIGGGGVLATLGWNTLNRRSEVRGLVTAIAREWKINDILLRDPLFTPTRGDILGSKRLYPRFKTSALNNALASGLLSATDPKGQALLTAVADYETSIADTNARLDVSDNFVLSTPDTKAIVEHRRQIVQSPGFTGFLGQHEKVKNLLLKDHS